MPPISSPDARPKEQKRNVILYIGAFELPDKNAAAQRVLSNARLFQSLGYEVILVGRNRAADMSDDEIRVVSYPDIEFECWETAYPNSTKAWFRQIVSARSIEGRAMERVGDRLFAVICYNYPAVAQLRLKWFANRLGGFGIADVTEWYQTLRANRISAVVKNIDTWARMRLINFRMDGLITTSPLLTRYYKGRINALAELPTLIDYQKPQGAKFRASNTGGAKRLFFAGAIFDPNALASEKGGLKDRLDWVIELLAEAHSKGAEFQLEMFGVARDEYLRICKHHAGIVEELGSKLMFHGRQPRKELLKVLVQSDFSIFLRKEMRVVLAGFPTKYSESVAYGTPVITSGLENLLPYMDEGKNSIRIEYSEKDAAVERLVEVLGWPQEEVQSMKEHCLKSNKFHFSSFQTEARQLFTTLENLS